MRIVGAWGGDDDNTRGVVQPYERFRKYCQETGLLEDLERLARSHRVTLKAVYERRHSKSVVRARQAIWLWLHDLGKSHPEIGELFGRDHTTIIYAVRRARELRDAQAIGDQDHEGRTGTG